MVNKAESGQTNRTHATNGDQTTQVEQGVFALITSGEGAERRYLLQWNAHWHRFNLIGGKVDRGQEDEESFRQTVLRELEEELGLRSPFECTVVRKLKDVKMRQFSERDHVIKQYHFHIYEVSLLPELHLNGERPNLAARWLSTKQENVFVTRAEIENLNTLDNRPISSTTRDILRELGEL
ncbi:MAG: NUDIX domain-containing protein [Anaerolineae bacterium]